VRHEGLLGIVLTVQVYKSASGRYTVDIMISQGPSLPSLHAALHLLQLLAANEVIAPNIFDKTGGNPLVPPSANRVRGTLAPGKTGQGAPVNARGGTAASAKS